MDILKQLETELIKPYLDEWVTFDEATYETLDRAVLFSLDVSPSWILQDGSDSRRERTQRCRPRIHDSRQQLE